MISGLFLHFPAQIIGLIFAVMRLDPDLTQTGAKTRWIYRDLFDKTARIYIFQSFSEYFNGGCKLHPPLWFPGSDRVSDGVSDRVCRALFHPRR